MPAPRWYDVPPGTPAGQCRGASCGKAIYWITTPIQTRVPVDCSVEGGRTPSPSADPKQADLFGAPRAPQAGRGVSHFLTCPDAQQFSQRRSG